MEYMPFGHPSYLFVHKVCRELAELFANRSGVHTNRVYERLVNSSRKPKYPRAGPKRYL